MRNIFQEKTQMTQVIEMLWNYWKYSFHNSVSALITVIYVCRWEKPRTCLLNWGVAKWESSFGFPPFGNSSFSFPVPLLWEFLWKRPQFCTWCMCDCNSDSWHTQTHELSFYSRVKQAAKWWFCQVLETKPIKQTSHWIVLYLTL